jgi:hypothetical protein
MQRLATLALVFWSAPLVHAQTGAAKYLPPNTEVVFTLNIEQILGSEVAQGNKELVQQARMHMENKLQEVGALQYLQQAGLDPLRDLRSVTVAGPGTKETDKLVVIVEGKFNPTKLKVAADEAAKDNPGSLTVTTLNNQPLYEINEPTGKMIYVTAVGSEFLLAAPTKELLSATAAQIRSGQTTELSKGFKSLLQTTSDKQSLSLTATGAALTRLAEAAPNNELIAGYLKSVTGLSLALTLSRDVQFQLGLNTSDNETAEQFSKMGNALLNGARGMLAQKAKEETKLAPAVEVAQTLRIVSRGNNVLLQGEVSYETIGKILKNLPQQK